MRRKLYWGGGGLLAGLSAVLAWGLYEVKDRPTFFVAFAGLLANVVMALAAAMAFRLWRAQLVGQAEHSAVMHMMRAVLDSEAAMHEGIRAVSNVMRQVTIFPDKPKLDTEQALISDKAIERATEQLVKCWDELRAVGVEARVALGQEGIDVLQPYLTGYELFTTAMHTFILEAMGVGLNALELRPGWSFRGVFRGELDDALECAEHYRKLVKQIVQWCEGRLGREVPKEPNLSISQDERTHLIFSVLNPQVVQQWSTEELARRAAQRAKAASGGGAGTT